MVESANHDCRDFAEEKKATMARPYPFTGSGLPNVFLVGVRYRVCRKCGAQSADIPAVKSLLKKIARAVVEKEAPLTGPEIRFLRKRLGKKAAEFGRIVGVTEEQVSRWENGHNPPEQSADKLIRVFYGVFSKDRALRQKVDRHIGDWLATLPGEAEAGGICARLHNREWTTELVAAH